MFLKRYKTALITFIPILSMFLLVIVILSIFLGEEGIFEFSPVENMGFDVFLILLITWASALIGGIVPGYILAPLLLVAHRYTIGLRMDYGIQNRERSETFKGSFRGFFPVLMAINFALMLSENSVIQEFIVGSSGSSAQPLTFNLLTSIIIGFSLAAFSAVWFLLEGGIVYTNRRLVREKDLPVEVRGVGSWLNYLLKGYAGISVIISYYYFLVDFTEIMLSGTPNIGSVIFLITWPILPIAYALILIPVFIILDMTYPHRKRFIQKFAKKLNISGPLEDPLNLEV